MSLIRMLVLFVCYLAVCSLLNRYLLSVRMFLSSLQVIGLQPSSLLYIVCGLDASCWSAYHLLTKIQHVICNFFVCRTHVWGLNTCLMLVTLVSLSSVGLLHFSLSYILVVYWLAICCLCVYCLVCHIMLPCCLPESM